MSFNISKLQDTLSPVAHFRFYLTSGHTEEFYQKVISIRASLLAALSDLWEGSAAQTHGTSEDDDQRRGHAHNLRVTPRAALIGLESTATAAAPGDTHTHAALWFYFFQSITNALSIKEYK